METSKRQQEALAELKERLRSLRVQQRLSMTSLPIRAGLSRTTVSQALNGTSVPSEVTVVALAAAVGTDPAPLLRLRARALPPTAPALTVGGTADAGPATHQVFESWYRQYVERQYGTLSVIGLDLSRPDRASWPMDAAYLSLEFTTPMWGLVPAGHQGEMGADVLVGSMRADVRMSSDSGAEIRVERAEQALAGRQRILVRGLAGSGKTTLLQWLAVATARRRLPPELSHLADCLPFVLPLRSLVRRRELPVPDQYLASVGCPRAGSQPPGWVDRVLLDGRGLILVDGLDEVPQAQREQTRQWLHDLLAAYPRAAYLVTTRPSAVPEGWLTDSGFTELTVRSMSNRDATVFVTRWYKAAAAGTPAVEERAGLAALEEALKDTVRSQPDLSRLTTTPLLCALVCALHRDRRGQLPHGRMELYEAALSMLLHRRDRERGIGATEGLVLTERQSVQVLQRLAYWLIRNGQTELDHDTARALIDEALPAMPDIAHQADAAQVLAHLIARSGLLRTPTVDTIDFVHRTFQDYLGAKAAIEARDIPLLVRNAHDDQWEDVLRMAVAHARPAERATLLRRLVNRGDRTLKHRSRLHLLATACLEYATEIDPQVRQEVRNRTAELLPPRSAEEAQALAAVGPIILDLLPGPDGLEDDEALAVVQTARNVGGDAALSVMKRFRNCTLDSVRWTIENSWSRFDTDDYAREILSQTPNLSNVLIENPEQLATFHRMKIPGRAKCRETFHGNIMTTSFAPQEISSLTISNNKSLENLDFLRSFTSLTELNLYDCPRVADLAGITELPIQTLFVFDGSPRCVEHLAKLAGVGYLGLGMELPIRDLGQLEINSTLKTLMLTFEACKNLTLRGIGRWDQLAVLNLTGLVDGFSEVATLPALKTLMLQKEANLSMLLRMPPAPQIKSFFMANKSDWTGEDGDLSIVRSALPGLQSLTLGPPDKNTRIDLTPLHGMPNLTIRLCGVSTVVGAECFPEGSITFEPRPRSQSSPAKTKAPALPPAGT